jgi:hypothetical protein
MTADPRTVAAMWRRRAPAVPRGTYTEWWWPDTGGLEELEHVLIAEVDPGPRSCYFWAHQFRTRAGEGGYLGLQTWGNRADGSLGKMAIFSFWDTLGAEGPGVVRFGGEGTGWSCRIPYYWEAGRAYRLRVAAVERESDVQWWNASVAEDGGDDVQIGRIRAPAAWGGLGTWSAMWTEFYGGHLSRCSDLPYSRVTFSTPTAEHGIRPVRTLDRLGDGTCEGSVVTRLADGVRHEMGRRPESASDG